MFEVVVVTGALLFDQFGPAFVGFGELQALAHDVGVPGGGGLTALVVGHRAELIGFLHHEKIQFAVRDMGMAERGI